ncbi:MAG: hypothetical protein ABSB35_33780 [Bryobacteraceae bacterium]|jgi:hypothetical protein
MGSIFRISRTPFAVLSWVLGVASLGSATNITYTVDQTIGAGGVTGDIVTDGTIGALAQSDVVDWNLLLNDGTNTFDLTGPLSGGNSDFEDLAGPGDLSATATQLMFDFSGTSASEVNYIYFQTNGATQIASGNLQSEVCFGGISIASICFGDEQLIVLGGPNQVTPLSGTQVIASVSASAPGVPEPSTFAMAFAALLVMGYRMRKRLSLRFSRVQ